MRYPLGGAGHQHNIMAVNVAFFLNGRELVHRLTPECEPDVTKLDLWFLSVNKN